MGGSFDDKPDQAPIPGLREAALTPDQKAAMDALEALEDLKAEKKEWLSEWKERHDAALVEAFDALDKLKVGEAGKCGRAIFETSL